jgi:hypothetical protein
MLHTAVFAIRFPNLTEEPFKSLVLRTVKKNTRNSDALKHITLTLFVQIRILHKKTLRVGDF